MGVGRKSLRVSESGNTTIEFIGFLLLLVLPLVTYFVQITHRSIMEQSSREILREIIQIVKTGDDFNTSISIAQRYLSLHDSHSQMLVSCVSGDCPKRGSIMRIYLKSGGLSLESTFRGSRWG